MIVKFAADGQVCEMVVEKRHIRASGVINVEETLLSTEERGWIVDELAPVAKRGKKRDFPNGLITVSGRGWTETEDYENVSIIYISSYTRAKKAFVRGPVAIVIKWNGRACKQG